VLKAYLQLIRLPNLITAIADILAGGLIAAIGIGIDLLWQPLVGLSLVSCMLYAGGVVQNDVVDAHVDSRERPERPIPAKVIPFSDAKVLARVLFASGIGMAYVIGIESLIISLLLFICIMGYNLWAKKSEKYRAIVMGICRTLNFCLGLSLVPQALYTLAWLGVFPFLHIVAVTILSSSETTDLPKGQLLRVIGLWGLNVVGLAGIGMSYSASMACLGFVFGYSLFWGIGLLSVIKQPNTVTIRRAVTCGILALILLDATLVAMFNQILPAIAISSLVIIPGILTRWISMT
jgi:4-hydroxybenzoate polyprenyltransferase